MGKELIIICIDTLTKALFFFLNHLCFAWHRNNQNSLSVASVLLWTLFSNCHSHFESLASTDSVGITWMVPQRLCNQLWARVHIFNKEAWSQSPWESTPPGNLILIGLGTGFWRHCLNNFKTVQWAKSRFPGLFLIKQPVGSWYCQPRIQQTSPMTQDWMHWWKMTIAICLECCWCYFNVLFSGY